MNALLKVVHFIPGISSKPEPETIVVTPVALGGLPEPVNGVFRATRCWSHALVFGFPLSETESFHVPNRRRVQSGVGDAECAERE